MLSIQDSPKNLRFNLLLVLQETPVVAQLQHVSNQSFYKYPRNWHYNKGPHNFDRLKDLMKGYILRADNHYQVVNKINLELHRNQNVHDIMACEHGYVMGEIIETEALRNAKKQMIKRRYHEGDRLQYLRFVQQAYIKVYHLTHMMHEISAKLQFDTTGHKYWGELGGGKKNRSFYNRTYWNSGGFNRAKDLNDIRNARVKAREDKVKKVKSMREMEMVNYGTVKPTAVKTTTNWWPLAYGWDIDYYW